MRAADAVGWAAWWSISAAVRAKQSPAARLPFGRQRRDRLDPAPPAASSLPTARATRSASRWAATPCSNGSANARRQPATACRRPPHQRPARPHVACGHQLGRGFNRVYTRHFLHTLKRHAAAKLRTLSRPLRRERRMLRARTLRIRRGRHGAAARLCRRRRLLAASSSKPWLAGIRLPTLMLNAQQRPFPAAPTRCLGTPARSRQRAARVPAPRWPCRFSSPAACRGDSTGCRSAFFDYFQHEV
jgi:hypothetical protein